jgi:dihydropteroate synthase
LNVAQPTGLAMPRILFVTGRLAEFALRRLLDDLAPKTGITADVAVLPISVAALMTPRWVARHLDVTEGVARVVLPGYCQGDLAPIIEKAAGVPVERGPADLRELPAFFGHGDSAPSDYGRHDIEILAEINHVSRLELGDVIGQAERFRAEGADVIDLGCDPGEPWPGIGDAVSALCDRGMRVSIDSFDTTEVASACAAGAELVLSVNANNRELAPEWGAEVVAVPDQPRTLEGLDQTIEFLARKGVTFRVDPILEPIGFGFAASLGRYLEVRRRYPELAMIMGVGNLTELTDVDSAGVNTILLGFCQELAIRSVLTTAVINWARSSVRELDRARRLVHHAVVHQVLPKHLEPALVALRDPKVVEFGVENLAELQRRIRDPNWRIFAEAGMIYALNNTQFLRDPDPFVLFGEMGVTDAAHAFYLGYEMMKAKTALTLSKSYRQDQALTWGFLTEAGVSHLGRKRQRSADGQVGDQGANELTPLDDGELQGSDEGRA